MPANDDLAPGEWGTTFLTPPLLSTLDRYRPQQIQLDSRSAALRRAFRGLVRSDWLCGGRWDRSVAMKYGWRIGTADTVGRYLLANHGQ
jgi:hypothetical protein